MAHAFLTRMAELIDDGGVTVHRFEFGYMAERTAGGSRRPAPRAESLVGEYLASIAVLRRCIGEGARLIAGGKSMGGRIACLAAPDAAEAISGVAVIGFPLSPPRKPTQSRAPVILSLRCPTLIVQGTRDPFGGPDAFAGLRIPPCVQLQWIEDGDHDLKPRRASRRTHDQAMAEAARAIVGFCKEAGR
jgi:predicted alpha/beta-hydrolase family hydrolase